MSVSGEHVRNRKQHEQQFKKGLMIWTLDEFDLRLKF